MDAGRLQRATTRAATVTAVAALLLLAAALSACAAAGPQSAETMPGVDATASPGPDASSAAASPSTSMKASPAPKPPLDRPTKKDPLRIYFGGDSLAGMPAVMLGMLTQENGLARVKADYAESSRLTHDDPVDWPARVEEEMSAGRYDVGVFMIGANDSGMPMVAGGESVMYPKRAWLEEYERRAKRIAALMLEGGVDRVYWVGMPIMPDSGESKKMRDLNEVFESVARSSPDVVYVDSYGLLSTQGGDHKASVRSGDGVHYTNQGALIVARAVWRAFKQDWGRR
jgi:hypothetical protein